MKYPRHTSDVVQLVVKPGQTLTVWLDVEPAPNARRASQVELRVSRGGCREIFVTAEDVRVRSFEEWEAMA